MNSELYSAVLSEEELKKIKRKGKLVNINYKTPKLQKELLKNTKWIDYGFVDSSDFIRRTVDKELIELGLLVRKNNKRPR